MTGSRKVKALDNEIETLTKKIADLKRQRAKLVKREVAHFRLRCTYDIVLSEDEIWPDDDAPINPSANDVKDLIEEYGSPDAVLKEWNLEPQYGDSSKITVTKLRGYD